MSNIYPIYSQERRYDEASRWVARLDKNLEPEEAEQLQRWMAAHPENEKVLLEMSQLWDKMDALGRLAALFPPIEKRHTWSPVLGGVVSFSLVLVAIFLWFAGFNIAPQPHPAPNEYVYQTAIGERASVSLADGSQLMLNTNTRLLVQYTDAYRLLTLERGEMFIEVAKDADRPLSVIAGSKLVQAVGTQFGVEINSDQNVELMVVEGKVKVGVHLDENAAAVLGSSTEQAESAQILVAGETMLLGGSQSERLTVSQSDLQVKLSWRQGKLIFRGESLEDAVREVERYTSVEFIFMDQDIKKIRVAGLFKAGDVDGLLATLRENFNIVYQYTDEKKVLLMKK